DRRRRPNPGRPADDRRRAGRAVPGPPAGRDRGTPMRWLRLRPGRPARDARIPASADPGAPGAPNAPDQDRWLRRLAGYCWRHRRLTIVAVGASLVATVVTTVIPLIQRDIIDNAIVARHQPIWPGATLLLVAAAISFCCVYLRRYRGGQLSLDVQHDLRTDLFGSLTRLDGARQDQLHTGQIVSRSISDLNMVQSLLGMTPMLIGNALLFVLSLIVMLVLSPLLTIIALAVGPVLLVLSIASRRCLFPASWAAQQQAGEVAGSVEGAVTGVRVVKGFGQEEQE